MVMMQRKSKSNSDSVKLTEDSQENINLQSDPETTKNEDPTSLLPHERDQTAGLESSKSNKETLRKIIKKAHKDAESGLKDTDLRGIPSDIVKTKISHQD